MSEEKRRYTRYEPGMRFGELTLIERLPGGHKWLCLCDCGNEVVTQIAGGSRSCDSCACKRRGNLKHGHNRASGPDRIYRIWIGMKSRCLNSNDTGYSHYGARGIGICDEWMDFEPFYDWSLKHGYREDLTIDRINNDHGYYPANCRWISMDEQAKNKRHSPYKYGRDEYGRFLKKERDI